MQAKAGRPVALVTGAAGGLGGVIARELAASGFDLVLNDLLFSDALKSVCDAVGSTGARVVPIPQDIAKVDELDGFVQRAHAAFGRLDCLVNNAGVSVLSRGDLLDVTPESFDRCVGVNLRAQFFLTQRMARRMIADGRPATGERRRSIITITTVAVDQMVGEQLAEYSTSKAGLSHAIKHFAARLVGEGIDCYEVRPGIMKTSMSAPSQGKYDALIDAGFVPARRWGELEDVAQAVVTLASGALRYAVGQTINIDGGMTLKTF